MNLLLDAYPKFDCMGYEIPTILPLITTKIITILQISVPIIIILFGMLDLFKSVMASKEEEIKKGREQFIKRLLVGVGFFLVFVIIKLVLGLIAPINENASMWNCIDCFVNGCKAIE